MATVWVLTGGIGSGKSTILGVLGTLGAETIDADAIGRAILEPGGSAHAAVKQRWPSAFDDDRIVRNRLAQIVFSEPRALRELEAISHPAIADTISRHVAAAASTVVVVEVSVAKNLAGVGWDRTIVADLPDEIRIQRLVGRGMDESDVRRRMANQPSRDGWRARGRWIISTAGSRDEVAAETERLWNEVIAPSALSPKPRA